METSIISGWFEAIITVTPDSKECKEQYLVADVSKFADAEKVLFEQVPDILDVVSLKRVNIYELIGNDRIEPDESYYLVEALDVRTDDNGKEKLLKYNVVTHGRSTTAVATFMDDTLAKSYDMMLGDIKAKKWRAILRP